MSTAVRALSRERTGGREQTDYLEFLNMLVDASGSLRWLTADEIVTSILELIDAGLNSGEPRKLEVYQKLAAMMLRRLREEEDVLELTDEEIDLPTVNAIKTIMNGGREAA
jgi:hypothetical protein